MDTMCWMGTEDREEGLNPDMLPDKYKNSRTVKTRSLKKVILYTFYKKPMANRNSNRQSSAMPESMKVSMTSNEIQRRMKNTSRDLPYPILDRILTNYMDELKLGGYSYKWRVSVLDCATKGFLGVWKKEKKGTGYINRPGYTGTTKSRFKRLCGKTSWIQDKHLQPKSATDPTQSEKEHIVKGRRIQRPPQFTESVMFVPYTPGGTLKREIQELDRKLNVRKHSGKTKIVEKLGRGVGNMLKNPYPWQNQHCDRLDCPPCQNQVGQCKSRNLVYRIDC